MGESIVPTGNRIELRFRKFRENSMPASNQHIDERTPMGATVIPDGCTFHTWAPRPKRCTSVAASTIGDMPNPICSPRTRMGTGRASYPVWQTAPNTSSSSWAKARKAGSATPTRELSFEPDYPHSNCVVRDSNAYPWHDRDFRPPAFNDLIIYQFHVGRFYAADADGRDRRPGRVAKFLDLLDRIEYWADLGITAIEPLPIQEFPHDTSLGYNGVDYFRRKWRIRSQ